MSDTLTFADLTDEEILDYFREECADGLGDKDYCKVLAGYYQSGKAEDLREFVIEGKKPPPKAPKKKTKTIIAVVLIAAAVVALAYWYFKIYKPKH